MPHITSYERGSQLSYSQTLMAHGYNVRGIGECGNDCMTLYVAYKHIMLKLTRSEKLKLSLRQRFNPLIWLL